MNGFVAAFLFGIAIACLWYVFRLFSLISESSSSEDFLNRFDRISDEKRKKRQAYWNHGMTRRDWFWWGRW